jgi:hypothetical protein
MIFEIAAITLGSYKGPRNILGGGKYLVEIKEIGGRQRVTV